MRVLPSSAGWSIGLSIAVAACGGSASAPNTPPSYTNVIAGANFTCAVDQVGAAYCWGDNQFGELGAGLPVSQSYSTVPVAVSGAHAYVDLAAGDSHACGRSAQLAIFCWGNAANGRAGAQASGLQLTPIAAGTTLNWLSDFAGGAVTCGIPPGGGTDCWGAAAGGQIPGSGDTATPVQLGIAFTAVAIGEDFACGLAASGTYCWGGDTRGALGVDSVTSPPYAKLTPPFALITIAAGAYHACALSSIGQPACWGDNTHGQTGTAASPSVTVPTAITTSLRFKSIAAGGNHTCALTTAGAAYCWGANGSGQLGDGTTSDHSTPTAVASNAVFTGLSAGHTHTCGVTADGRVLCWGANAMGQLGNGSTTGSTTPGPINPPR